MFVLFGAIVAGFALFHASKRIKGSKKHRIRFVNITLIAVAAVCFALMMTDLKTIDSKRSKYTVHTGTIISGLYYEKQQDGYNFFHETQLFSSGEFVISESDAKLPWITKLYSHVAIYQSIDGRSDIVNIDGHNYTVMKDVKEIVPDYFLLFLGFIIIDLVTLAAFDLVMLFRVMLENKVKGEIIPDENEEKTKS